MSAASGISMYAMLGAWRGENANALLTEHGFYVVVVILVPMKEKTQWIVEQLTCITPLTEMSLPSNG